MEFVKINFVLGGLTSLIKDSICISLYKFVNAYYLTKNDYNKKSNTFLLKNSDLKKITPILKYIFFRT